MLSGNIFIFLIFCLIFFASAKYDCGTKDVIYLNKGIIAYFETTNFPAPLSIKQFSECNLTFAVTEKDTASHVIISTTTKIYDHNFVETDHQEILNLFHTSSFSLQNIGHKEENTIALTNFAQEGFVVFADKNKTFGCLANEDPTAVYSEYEILFLLNTGLFNFSSDYCIWKFSAPQNYGFKVVIVTLDNASDTELYIKNSTDTYVNKRSVKKSFAHYNDDNYIEVQVSNNRDTIFFAYVTIVEKTKSRDLCSINKKGNTTIWNIDTYLVLSVLNIKCYFEIIIPEATEYIVSIEPFILEKNVDYIRYIDKYNDSFYVNVNPSTKTIFKLFNYNNGSNSRYLFEYSSDGSIPSLGTFITFTKLTCRCGPSVIMCPGNFGSTGIMDKDNQNYCGNLHCNFTIAPCQKDTTESKNLTTTLLFRMTTFNGSFDTVDYANDIFRTYSNGHLTAEAYINYFHSELTDFVLYFDYSSSNMFEVITFPTKVVKNALIITEYKPRPKIVGQMEISLDNPYLVFDVGTYRDHKSSTTLIKVTVSKDIPNPSLILFSNTEHATELFHNESLTSVYNSVECFGDSNKLSCELRTNEFVIFCPPTAQSYPILAIQLSGYHRKGCVLNNYIYIAKEDSSIPIVAVATPNDECTIIILINLSTDYHYYISDLWTTSFPENVQIFAGNDHFLFEFNSHSAHKWTSIGLYSNLYTIKVPKKATIYLHLKKYDAKLPTIYVFGTSYSLYHTAGYGLSKTNTVQQTKISYCARGHDLKFTALYYNSHRFYLFFTDIAFYPDFNKTGDIFLLKNMKCIMLQYLCDVDTNVDDGVIILIETIKNENEVKKLL